MYIHNNENISGEIKQIFRYIMKNNTRGSEDKVMEMLEHHELDELDVNIVKFLYDTKIASQDQICRRFGENDRKIIELKLKKLVPYRILNEFMLGDGEEMLIQPDAMRFYTIDYVALSMLRPFVPDEDLFNWNARSMIIPLENLKKTLLATDFRIVMETKLDKPAVCYDSYRLFTMGRIKMIPNAQFFLSTGKTDEEGHAIEKPFILKTIVSDDLAHADHTRISETVCRWETWYYKKAWEKYFREAPVLIFACDSQDTMVYIRKMLDDMIPEKPEEAAELEAKCEPVYKRVRLTYKELFDGNLETCLLKYDAAKKAWVRTKLSLLKEKVSDDYVPSK